MRCVGRDWVADPQNRLEQITKALRDKGYRLTPQRLAMLKIIAASLGHPNAEQIYEQMKADVPATEHGRRLAEGLGSEITEVERLAGMSQETRAKATS